MRKIKESYTRRAICLCEALCTCLFAYYSHLPLRLTPRKSLHPRLSSESEPAGRCTSIAQKARKILCPTNLTKQFPGLLFGFCDHYMKVREQISLRDVVVILVSIHGIYVSVTFDLSIYEKKVLTRSFVR